MKAKIKNEDVFSITGRGVVIAGRIIEGFIELGDILIIGDKYIKIRGIESFRKAFNTANPGDNIGILLDSDITKDEAMKYKGQILDVTTKSDMRQELLIELGI